MPVASWHLSFQILEILFSVNFNARNFISVFEIRFNIIGGFLSLFTLLPHTLLICLRNYDNWPFWATLSNLWAFYFSGQQWSFSGHLISLGTFEEWLGTVKFLTIDMSYIWLWLWLMTNRPTFHSFEFQLIKHSE